LEIHLEDLSMKKTFTVFALLLCMLILCFQPAFAADQVFFYHADPAGTPLAMTNANGQVVWKADYKPFGEEQTFAATTGNDRRFVGKEKDDETGLSYFGARYHYDKIGRFIAPDPVRVMDENTSKTNERMLLNSQRLNTYAYGLNNPYRYIDPNGLAPILLTESPNSIQRFSGGSIGNVAGGSFMSRSMPRGGGGGSSGTSIGYHATFPEAAESIVKNGFNRGTKPGRLGSNGTYVNSTPEGAVAEFQFQHPGVKPKVIEVEYSPGVNAAASVPPRNYVKQHPINADSISAPSVRAPGTISTNILNGSALPSRILP
jgi:RHS repeat-associated protein